MNLVEEQKIREHIRKVILEMANYAQLNRILQGERESVNTVGVMTAENPQAVQLTSKENKQLIEKLKSDLNSIQKGFIPITGKFGGNIENSLVIMNISKEELI